jgi:hypothetical protein
MNAHNCPPGTLLLASSRCPFCGSRLDVIPETASSGHKGYRGFCTGALGVSVDRVYQQPVCDVGPQVWKPTREEAIAAICRRVR